MEKKTLEMNDSLRKKLEVFLALEESKIIVMKPVGLLKNKYDAASVVEVTKAVAEAKSCFWNEVYRTYPETKNGSWAANATCITEY